MDGQADGRKARKRERRKDGRTVEMVSDCGRERGKGNGKREKGKMGKGKGERGREMLVVELLMVGGQMVVKMAVRPVVK